MLSAQDVHGKKGDEFLSLSTAQLVQMFKSGGKERNSAALEIGRRKVNRSEKKQA